MDIFGKCYAPSLAAKLKEDGVYPYFHALQSRQDVEVMMEGKRRISRSVARMEHDEQTGMDPAKAGAYIADVGG